MEPLTIFASTVGFIGAFHLLSRVIERSHTAGERKSGKRDDWYCFFQLSDLVGREAGQQEKNQVDEARIQDLEQRRRQQANRPRMQA